MSVQTHTRIKIKARVVEHKGFEVDPTLSLSKYFPPDTAYFYSFPSGAESRFFNSVPPWVEELVAGRTMLSATARTKTVVFDAPAKLKIREWLEKDCGLPLAPESSLIILPESVHANVSGSERNSLVKESLRNLVGSRTLVMAQPFLDDETEHLFQLRPHLSAWFNDKANLQSYIPEEYLAQRYARFSNGLEFASVQEDAIPLPCVVKVSSSSAGDGVRICKSVEDIQKAKSEFANLNDTIFIEQYIQAVGNYGIQFGIPYDQKSPIEIIGYNHQVITEMGEFLGGVVYPHHILRHQSLPEIFRVLREVILPAVREMGWYGVGGLDALVDEQGKFYFIDSNFRQTAMFSFVCLSRRGHIKKPVASFIGTFKGSEQGFKKMLEYSNPTKGKHIMQIISLTQDRDVYRFNAGILYDDAATLKTNAMLLKKAGIESKVLDVILTQDNLSF